MRISQEDFLGRFAKSRKTGPDRFMVQSPLRSDSSPSVSIKFLPDRILLNDFGGDDTGEILAAVGLSFSDILPDRPTHQRQKPGKPYASNDMLSAMVDDLNFVLIASRMLAKGEALTERDNERISELTERFQRAIRIAGLTYD